MIIQQGPGSRPVLFHTVQLLLLSLGGIAGMNLRRGKA